MCKNYYKGESGETKSSVVILVLILMSYCRRCVRITKEKVRETKSSVVTLVLILMSYCREMCKNY